METTSIQYRRKERIKHYPLDNDDSNPQNSFSDFQYSVIHSNDTAHPAMWVADFVSLDQSDCITLD